MALTPQKETSMARASRHDSTEDLAAETESAILHPKRAMADEHDTS